MILTSFPHVCPIRDFHDLSHETPWREADAGEAGHTPECNICNKKPITHFYTQVMDPTSLRWEPDALEPHSGETLAPL
jgi:hypothetical protein